MARMTSVTLRKARRVLAEGGPAELTRHGVRELVGLTAAYRSLRRRRSFDSSAELVEFASSVGGGVIAPFQEATEIASLLDRVKVLQPRVVLEVGTANGGTLLLLARSSHPQATIISVDLGPRASGRGYPLWRIPVYRRFASQGQKIHLIRADSHEPSTLARVEEILDGRKIDLLFVDGDHSEVGVRADFELLGARVRRGGLVAFHDIVPTADSGVHRLWHELKASHRHEELVADPTKEWSGIGLLYVD